MSDCPTTEQLDTLIHGQLSSSESIRLEGHIETCRRCKSTLEQLLQIPSLILDVPIAKCDPADATSNWNNERAHRLADAVLEAVETPIEPETQVDASYLPQIDGFDVHGLLGRGGMGAVFHARQWDLDRDVALKVLEGVDRNRNQSRISRFSREAKITAKLDHPSIVPVYQIGTDNEGRCFYTMRRVQGQTLKDVFQLTRQQTDGWNVPRAIAVLVRICQALEFAHQHDVIHRDLKPANIMVGDLGEVYVLDWGLAKSVGDEDVRDVRPAIDDNAVEGISRNDLESTQNGIADRGSANTKSIWENAETIGMTSSNGRERSEDEEQGFSFLNSPSTDPTPAPQLRTMDGAVIGTPAFMPPEQASGDLESIDHRSDIYALGTILYQLLAGRPPYVDVDKKTTPNRIVRAILAGPPQAISDIAVDAPPELIAICEKAMARKRELRYEAAIELADDLQAFLDQRVVKAYATGSLVDARLWVRRNRTVAFGSLLAIVLAVSGLLTHSFLQSRANRKLTEANDQVSESLGRERETSSKLVVANADIKQALERESEAKDSEASAKKSEERAKLEAYELLASSYTNFAELEIGEEQFARAALWYQEAADLITDDPERRQIHRMRAKQCADAAFRPVAAWWNPDDLMSKSWLRWPQPTQFSIDRTGKFICTRDNRGAAIIVIDDQGIQLWKKKWFLAAAVSLDGRLAAISAKKGTVDLYQLENDTKIHSFSVCGDPENAIRLMDFNETGTLLFVGSTSGRVFDMASKSFLPGIYPVPDNVTDLGLRGDDKQVLIKNDKTIRVFDIDQREGRHQPIVTSAVATWKDPKQQAVNSKIRTPFFLRQRQTDVTEFPDGTPFDPQSYFAKFGHHSDISIEGSAVALNGSILVVAHGNGIIRQWTPPPRRYWILPTAAASRPVFSSDGSLLVPVGHLFVNGQNTPAEKRRKELRVTQVYDPLTAKPIGAKCAVGAPILDGCFSNQGDRLVLACGAPDRTQGTVLLPDGQGGTLQVWDWKKGKRLGEPFDMPSEPQVVSYHPKRQLVAVRCGGAEVVLVDLKTRKITTVFKGDHKNIPMRWGPGDWIDSALRFDDSGKRLMSAYGHLVVLDVETGELEYSIKSDRFITSLETKNNLLLRSGLKGVPVLHNFRTGRYIFEFANGGSIAHFSRDGRYAITSGSTSRSTSIWDTQKTRKMTCPPFGDRARDSAFIDGTPYVITVDQSTENVIRFWDRREGRIAAPPMIVPDKDQLGYIHVAAGGKVAAIGCINHGLVVLDLQSWHEGALDQLSSEDLQLLAHINAGATLINGRLVRTTAANWINKWEDFQSRNPDYFGSPSSDEAGVEAMTIPEKSIAVPRGYVDLSAVFNADVVRDRDWGTDGYVDDDMEGGNRLVTDAYADRKLSAGNGLPDDGLFSATSWHPEIQLSYQNDPNDNNAIQLQGAGSSVTFEVQGAAVSKLHLLAIATSGQSVVGVTLNYDDGSVQLQTQVDDWFDDEFVDGDTHGDAVRYYLINGMDRFTFGGCQERDDAAVFGHRFEVDPLRKLNRVTVSKTDTTESRLVLLGAAIESATKD